MIWKIVLLFLCAMALVAMIGKLVFPDRGASGKAIGRKAGLKAGRDFSRKFGFLLPRCKSCGKTPGALGGASPCSCEKDRS